MQLTTSASQNRCKSVGGFADGRIAGIMRTHPTLSPHQIGGPSDMGGRWSAQASASTARKVENAKLLFGRVQTG